MDRREFFKKAGLVGGLSAAGAVTLKKQYVKPVIQMLEPRYAEALTPVLSVTASQPAGNSFKAGGGGAFTVGVWSIDVPLSAPIPANVQVAVEVKFISLTDDGIVSGAGTGIPPGTELFPVPDPFATGPGEFRLIQTVGATGTSQIIDGQGNFFIINPKDQPKLNDAFDEIFNAPPGGAPTDAFLVYYEVTVQDCRVLDVNIPNTCLPLLTCQFSGDID